MALCCISRVCITNKSSLYQRSLQAVNPTALLVCVFGACFNNVGTVAIGVCVDLTSQLWPDGGQDAGLSSCNGTECLSWARSLLPPGAGAVPALGAACIRASPLPCEANQPGGTWLGLLLCPPAGLWHGGGCWRTVGSWELAERSRSLEQPLGTASPALSSCHASGCCPHCTHSCALKCAASGKHCCSTSGGGIEMIISKCSVTQFYFQCPSEAVISRRGFKWGRMFYVDS